MRRQRLLSFGDQLLIAWAFLTSCPGQIKAQVVRPATDWPETRDIASIDFNPVVDSLLAMWSPADTVERALCLYGSIESSHVGRVLRLGRSEAPDSVVHVRFDDGSQGLWFRCRAASDYVGYAHTHPYVPGVDTWLRSQRDAAHFARDEGGLIQLVVMAHGYLSWWMRDGRFGVFRLEVGS